MTVTIRSHRGCAIKYPRSPRSSRAEADAAHIRARAEMLQIRMRHFGADLERKITDAARADVATRSQTRSLDQVPKLLGIHIIKEGFFRDMPSVTHHVPDNGRPESSNGSGRSKRRPGPQPERTAFRPYSADRRWPNHAP